MTSITAKLRLLEDVKHIIGKLRWNGREPDEPGKCHSVGFVRRIGELASLVHLSLPETIPLGG